MTYPEQDIEQEVIVGRGVLDQTLSVGVLDDGKQGGVVQEKTGVEEVRGDSAALELELSKGEDIGI